MVAWRVTAPLVPTLGGALVGSTKPAASAMLRSSASGHSVMAPNLLALTMAAPEPTACTKPPLCACMRPLQLSDASLCHVLSTA